MTAALLSVRGPQPALLASAHAAVLTWPLLTLACGLLVLLLLTNQFQVEYVAASPAAPCRLPQGHRAVGRAGRQPALLELAHVHLRGGGVCCASGNVTARFMPFVIAVIMVTLGFFVSWSCSYENPFVPPVAGGRPAPARPLPACCRRSARCRCVPADGRGLNPLLRHPGMIIHPPMLYMGFVSFVVPYAFAMAALFARRADDEWIRTTRRWTLVGWLFLSLGLILGGRWAYDVLGWGGYWGWDPVENAAFLPWLTATAFLHSVMIQEKRGMLKKWNMVLIVLTYSLVIFGTFLTRSGVLSSVHAFAQSAIGPAFFIFIALTFGGSLALLFREWDHLRSDHQLDQPALA